MHATPEQLASAGETHLANAEAQNRAAQIFAEMLGLVCHREYIACGNQMVHLCPDNAYGQVFVIQLAGLKLSIYWAEFPVQYLDTIRNHNVRDLASIPKVTLHHTQPQSLIVSEERDRFLQDYVSVVHFVAGGYGKVGFLRRDTDSPIHRDVDHVVNSDIATENDDV